MNNASLANLVHSLADKLTDGAEQATLIRAAMLVRAIPDEKLHLFPSLEAEGNEPGREPIHNPTDPMQPDEPPAPQDEAPSP